MQKRRTDADIVRTILWFDFICKATGQDSAFKLGQKIERETYSTSLKRQTCHNNKFSYFKKGKHTPHPDLVKKVDLLIPGSSYLLNMPLWKTFEPDFTTNSVQSVLRQLPQNVLSAARLKPHLIIKGEAPIKYCDSYGKHLARIGTYDALCMLMIFWRIDSEDMPHPNRMKIAVNIYHLLLILSGELFYYGICEQFFLLFKRHIFDHARSDGYRFDVTDEKFIKNAEILNLVYPFDKGLQNKAKEKRNTAIGMTLQKSSNYFELYLVLNNIFDYDETGLPPEKNVILKLIYERLCADWGHKLLFGKHQVSLTDTITKYVLNNPNITELDEEIFITKAQISSMIRNI